jgi:alkylation response protein AidB-like acyl-CoA dehydrogenase
MHDMLTDELPEWLRKAPRRCDDPLKAARALRPLIEASADEGARLGYVPDNVVRAIAEAGLFGLLVARDVGGMEVDAVTYIDVIEELSYADGSTGWVVMATGFSAGGASSALGPSAIEAIFGGDAGYIGAGQVSSLGKAERVEGGYRVSGDFHFGSGSRYASWFLGAFALQKDGQPVLTPEGKPQLILGFAPRHKVRLTGNWDVMGLSATGSYDFQFVDQIMPDDFTMDPKRPRRRGPIDAIGVSIGHSAWALGAGMRALDEIKTVATRKRRFGRTTLIDQPVFQRDFAEHSAAMEAARAYIRSAFDTWHEAAKTGKPSLEVRAQARLAACWATQVAVKAGAFAYLASGSDGLRNNDGKNTLQRVFRDLHAGSQHRHIDINVMIEASSALLGVADPAVEL